MRQTSVSGVELDPAGLAVRASDYGTFTRALAKVAKEADIRLTGVLPSDESLEDVFSYLVAP
jgi:ABC-2 type transport system ATP-binding protein